MKYRLPLHMLQLVTLFLYIAVNNRLTVGLFCFASGMAVWNWYFNEDHSTGRSRKEEK